jgi:imidazolonepropionase-like amidohydrolase
MIDDNVVIGIKEAILAGVRSIEHASFIDDEGISLALEKGVYIVPTVYIGEYFEESASSSGPLSKTVSLQKR